MNDDEIKNRWRAIGSKNSKSDDLFAAWEDQRKMQEEDRRIQDELTAAKKRAKELQKTLYKHKFGYSKDSISTKMSNYKITVSTQAKKLYGIAKANKKKTLPVVSATLIVVVAFLVYPTIFNNKQNATLGDSTDNLVITEDLPREKPDFKLLYPAGRGNSDYDTVRISPPEAAPSYTYLDRLTADGQIFRVTQQQIPENFDLKKVATDFQATSVIQVDEVTVYHGYNEQGGTQSILFEKDKKLITIRSSQKFSDDQWAAYISSLK